MSPESITVLVIDDDEATRLILRAALEWDGYRIEEAADGEAGLAATAALEPDLILLDAMMPGLDGFEVCRRLTAPGPGRAPAVLMVTGLRDDDVVERAFAAGAADFVGKPFRPPVLRQRVRRLIAARRAEVDLVRLAYHDALTGLPNRALFADRFGTALSRIRRLGPSTGGVASALALLLIDLDDFKVVNDSLGHSAGDELLRTVSERLSRSVRESDTVARLGGDEFAVLLDEVADSGQAAMVARRILDAIAEPIRVEGRELALTASVGIAMSPANGTDIGTLTRAADTALYRAKSSGGGCPVFYSEEMGKAALRRMLVTTALRQALPARELSLLYQPQVDLSSGRVVAAEALARWNHPDLGMVSPMEFIPAAEHSGLIVPIGAWVLDTACRQVSHWRAQDSGPPRVAVNVSPRQLDDPTFPAQVEEALLRHHLEPSALELEVTESGLVGPGTRRNALEAIHATGVRLAIDDFGTGYSSLCYLRDLPFDAVKVDRGFIANITEGVGDLAVMEAVLAMGGRIGFETVAEGLETPEQRELLTELGCDLAQGYLLGRPGPAEALAPTARQAAIA
ncbi:MAG: EAL domain-containing protein [Ectothiorhodospiraceae bacterium]|nr:EAL domain-containing protein [Ectothiorhodospiraceae bacterium]